MAEGPILDLPTRNEPYSYTKAYAENLLLDSAVPAILYRLGILVGDTVTGQVEKIDGPYYLLNFLHQLHRRLGGKTLPILPLLAPSEGYLPLVPVDVAARVICSGLFLEHSEKAIYGVHNPDSITLGPWIQRVLRDLNAKVRPIYIKRAPTFLKRLEGALAGLPAPLFDFASVPEAPPNPRFTACFGAAVPHFDDYAEAFFKGFRQHDGA